MPRAAPKGRRCTICQHPQRPNIDLAIATGISRRLIAARFKVSADAAWRHGRAHLTPEIRAALATKVLAREGDMRRILLEEGTGELLERVRENDHLDSGAEFIQKFPGAFQQTQTANDFLDVGKLEPMLVEYLQSPAHQDVIVRFVAGRAAQFLDAGLFGHGDPDFRSQHPLHVQGHD